MRRRAFLISGTAAFLGSSAWADDYLADARTAQGVRFASPRAPLGQCLEVLSKVTGVPMSAGPELANEPLTGYVPRLPLRETMGALEELFDAAWSTAPGKPGAYILRPDPVKSRATAARNAAILKKQRAEIDSAAAEAARGVGRSGNLPPDRTLQPTFALALWGHLTPAERDRVFQGSPVTVSVPEAQAETIYSLLLSISRREKAPLVAPLLASFDLDDVTENGMPSIRVRATALRASGITGGIGTIPIGTPQRAPASATLGGPMLPQKLGENGQIGGTREEVVLKLGQAAELPILSRHRALGGSGGVQAAGRTLGEVMTDLSNPSQLDAVYHATARGFQLFRSATEWIDRVALPPAALVSAYLAGRPPEKSIVSFLKLLPLAQLTPVQLAILERGNSCSNDAHAAREVYALMRFYLSLNPEQQTALFTPQGIDAGACTHLQLHQLLAGKDKRAEWDVEGPLQQRKGLRLRFIEMAHDAGRNIEVEAVRDGKVLASGNTELPVVEAEDAPKAVKE